jgi:AraC-like DNA-binding protein
MISITGAGRSRTNTAVVSPAYPPIEMVDNHILSFFPDLVQEMGHEPNDLLGALGIDRAVLCAGTANISYRQMVEAVASASIKLSCPDFGMRLAKRQAGHIRSPLMALMKSCDTVGEALNQASAHSEAHSPVSAIWIREPGDNRVLVGHDILLEGLSHRAQAMEQILLIASLSIREVSGGRVRPRQVHFRHLPISLSRTYRRFFGCEVIFGQDADALVLRKCDMSCPTVDPDKIALDAALARIEAASFPRSPLHAGVRGAIMHNLGTDRCTNSQVARAFGHHVKAMHRQLASEDTSFQRIKTEVRRDLALYYLEETELDLTGISVRLGFAEQSALTYFCRKWLSATPTQIRSRAHGSHVVNTGAHVRNKQV